MKRSRMQGLTLVELMVSMVLGLVVVGGAVSLMLANRQSYRTNEGLSQVQESARTAFELLSRDVRQAGVVGCDTSKPLANLLNQGGDWWTQWFGIAGFDGSASTSASAIAYGTARGERVAGTDAFQVQTMQGLGFAIAGHNTTSSELTLTTVNPGDFVGGDVLMICDFEQTTIFQVQTAPSNVKVTYGTGGAGVLPGNCTVGFGFPVPSPCTQLGTPKAYGTDSQISRLAAVDWYIGNSGRTEDGGRSLFRVRLDRGAVLRTEEVVAGITDMQVTFRIGEEDEFVDADLVAANEWSDVNAVRIALTAESADVRISTDADVNEGRLSRDFVQVVTLRNRVP